MDKVLQVLEQIEAAARNANSDERRVNPAIGQVVRQGDIYISRVADDHPHGDLLPHRQLADGTTMGSRHIVDRDAPVEVYAGTTRPAWVTGFLGPCVVATGEWGVGHPEHARCVLGPGTYQVTHQMDALTLQRVEE